MIAGICRRYAIVDERGLRDAVVESPQGPRTATGVVLLTPVPLFPSPS